MGVVRFFLLMVAAWWVARLLWRWLQPAPPRPSQEDAAHILSRCSRCGTLIPQDLVVWHEDRPYCSLACRPS
ncbi:MAG: hypothetical protein HQL87_11295 [Magnetococcales bacterium]|nr:hypothetical protein [Magnetococcales bacterium]